MPDSARRTFYRSEEVVKKGQRFARRKGVLDKEIRESKKEVEVTWRREYWRWAPAVVLVVVGALGALLLAIDFRLFGKPLLVAGPPITAFVEPRFVELPLPKTEGEISLPEITAKSFIVEDPVSGTVLASKSANLRLLPASTAKIVTALVALDIYKLGDIVTVGEVVTDGQQVGLESGEKISVENILYGMLVESGNDAAFALADFDPLGRNHFIQLMNQKALRLGLKNTHFANPAGLDDSGQYSTAEDLAEVGAVAMADPSFSRIVGTQQSVIFSSDQTIEHRLTNVNQLLGKIPGIRGIKTGYTEEAGQNLVTDVVRDSHEIVTVVLGSKDRFRDTGRLVDWAYDSFKWTKVQVNSGQELTRKP